MLRLRNQTKLRQTWPADWHVFLQSFSSRKSRNRSCCYKRLLSDFTPNKLQLQCLNCCLNNSICEWKCQKGEMIMNNDFAQPSPRSTIIMFTDLKPNPYWLKCELTNNERESRIEIMKGEHLFDENWCLSKELHSVIICF